MMNRFTIEEHSVFLGGVLVLLFLMGIAAAGPTDDVIIGINISQVVSIDVSPNSTNWTGLSVGETGTPHYFTVTNVGSVNISSLRANITNDDSNPYGTGNPLAYDAGEFVLLNTSSSSFYYIQKRNWNDTLPGDVTSPADWTEGNATGYFGWVRTASDSDVGEDYRFFTNRTADSGDCWTGSGELYIANTPKTVTQDGTLDFTGADFTTVTVDTSGIGDIDTNAFSGYCVLVTADCGTLTIFKWNTDLDTSSGCDNEAEFYPSTDPEIKPGNYTNFYLEPKIPNGVPDGDVQQGTLTIIATGA